MVVTSGNEFSWSSVKQNQELREDYEIGKWYSYPERNNFQDKEVIHIKLLRGKIEACAYVFAFTVLNNLETKKHMPVY